MFQSLYWAKALNSIPRETVDGDTPGHGLRRDRDLGLQDKGWATTLDWALQDAVQTTDLCPESRDGSVLLRFSDRSVLRVDNPRQMEFCGQATDFTISEIRDLAKARRRLEERLRVDSGFLVKVLEDAILEGKIKWEDLM